MQPIQTLRLAAVSLLLTAGFSLLPSPNLLLPAVAQTAPDRKTEDVSKALQEANRLLATAKQHYRRAEFKSAIALYQQALTQAQQTGDVSTQIEALLQLGDINFWIDDVPQAEAKFQQALKLSREVKDRAREGSALAFLSAVHRNRQEYGKAIALLKESSAIAQQTKDQKLETRSRLLKGTVFYRQKQYSQALETFQSALKIAQADNNQDEIADIYNWMAFTFIQLKDLKQAETTIQQQQKLSRDTGYRLAEYDGLATIASLQQEQKRPDQVLRTYEKQSAIAQAADNPWFQKATLLQIGLAYIEQKQLPQGFEYLQKALVVARTIDDDSVGWVQNRIGVAYHRAKQYPQALEAYQQAIALYQKTANQFELAQVWRNVGQIYHDQKQHSQAREAYQQAIALYQQRNNLPGQANTLHSIGHTYLSESNVVNKQNKYAQAFKLAEQGLAVFQQSLEIARKIPDQQLEAFTITGISQAYGRQGDVMRAGGDDTKALALYTQALKVAEQALAINKQLQNQEGIESSLTGIGILYVGLIQGYNSTKQFGLALETVRKAKSLEGLTDEVRNLILRSEILVYYSLDSAYDDPRQYAKRLEILQKVIELAKQLNDRETEGRYLVGIAQTYYFWGRYAQALDVYQQALSRIREVKDYQYEVFALLGMGSIYSAQANYPEALKIQEQALQLSRANNVPNYVELVSLNNIANVYTIQGQYAQAMSTHQQVLATHQKRYEAYSKGVTPNNIRAVCLAGGNFRETAATESKVGSLNEVCDNPEQLPTGSRLNAFKSMINSLMKVAQFGSATSFSSIAAIYSEQGSYPKALELQQKSLGMFREQGKRSREANSLNNLGTIYISQGNYTKALEEVQQAVNIAVEQNDPANEISYRLNLGLIYFSWGKYPEALAAYQQSLALSEQLGRPSSKAAVLSAIATVHSNQGQFAKALANYQAARDIWQKVGEPANESYAIGSIGGVYSRLGQYPQAIAAYQQALAITQKINARPLELQMLSGLATTYREQGQTKQALKTFQQALNLAKEIGDRNYESLSLAGMGKIYLKQSQPQQALAALQPALTIQQQIGTRPNAADTLSSIGQAHLQLGTSSEAQSILQQAIALARETGDAPIEAQALSAIGQLFAKNQPELAIAFYKQSVGLQEEIKGGLKSLARSEQESYAQSVSGTYRALADLLLAQGRILEAQQVLELLKIQEIREFTREVKTAQSAGIATTASEAKILKEHGSLIAFGQTVNACKQSRCAQLSALNDQQQTLTQQYNQTVSSFEKEIRQRKSVDDALLDPRSLSSKAKEIVESQPGTVLIYPFVLEDKIWLLWAAKGGIVKSVAVPVSRKQLGETVVQFRQAVQSESPGDRKAMLTAGKQLYDWLIKPLEPELKANKIQNLVFSLDRVTRYIPMSALFDGKQYLIENYAVSTILSAELTDLRDRLPANNQTSILALGASEFKDDPPLPNVPAELNAIIQQKSQPSSNNGFSGSKFLNQSFNFRALRDNLVGHKILHIATHGKFVSGRPEDSFLVLGSGEKLTIPEIKTLQDLSNIHLVVLSACETALGGADQDGVEISGLSSYFLSNGAKAVMASLWSVDDASTSVLMSEFYRTLATSTPQKPMTKAEALRQAQLSLIREGGNFARPYFWAPFTLIGNSL